MIIFENIRVLAILQRRDIKSLMEESGIERQVFYNAERRGSIETEKLYRIAETLGVKPELLFRNINNELLKFIEKMNSEPSGLQLPQQ